MLSMHTGFLFFEDKWTPAFPLLDAYAHPCPGKKNPACNVQMYAISLCKMDKK